MVLFFYDEKRPKISEKEFNKIIDDKKDIIEKNWPSFDRKQIWQYCIEGTGSADNTLDMEKIKGCPGKTASSRRISYD